MFDRNFFYNNCHQKIIKFFTYYISNARYNGIQYYGVCISRRAGDIIYHITRCRWVEQKIFQLEQLFFKFKLEQKPRTFRTRTSPSNSNILINLIKYRLVILYMHMCPLWFFQRVPLWFPTLGKSNFKIRPI